ncbi:hypothetical protein HEK616_36540 [Streptomyces nigrescens]|uniref:Uncharacterized protein n=1 Tax=Streptomyces nigrescens TaxID=1920 RepID=A0ABN6QXM2_STRNI|nr:hypothetical protein HEK616_36540 [Streptomyces nigrescens]
MSGTHTMLHDPHGLIEAELPLDRASYETLVAAVLTWTDPHLGPRDYEPPLRPVTGPHSIPPT